MASLRPQLHQAGGRKSRSRNTNERSPLLPNGQSDESNHDGHRHFWGDNDASPWSAKPKRWSHMVWLTLSNNYVNILLVFVPVGIVMGIMHLDPVLVFVMNFLAIIPLAALLSFATEELSAELGQTIGGLMNASFGNAVELIVSIAALASGQIRIVQAGMLGSILSNILLVLGCCFVAGGLRGGQQHFSAVAANTMSSLLAVATASLIIPAALSASLNHAKESSSFAILFLSRGTSIILLLLYLLYLFFQLRTHASVFEGERADEEAESEDDRILHPVAASIALLAITLLVAVCAEFLVDSIDAVVERTHVSKSFIGLILLPIVGNAAEHVTACIVAYKGKMDLAIGVAIGSSLQIALFVTPFMVMLGWAIGQPMTLHFMGFETVVFFISVVVVNYLIQDGESNYLEGALCIGMYIVIGIAFYLYPDDAKDIGAMLKEFFKA